jgi:hypothetical protein
MSTLSSLALVLGFDALGLMAPLPASAIDFYVNACCLKTTPVSGGGEVRTITGHVGTNVPYTATVHVTLSVTGPNTGCAQSAVVTAPFVNAVTMPVHFRVTYPPPSGKLNPAPKLGVAVYTVLATIDSIVPPPPATPPPADVPGNNSHRISYRLPAGGTPQCVKAPAPN